MVPRQGCPVSSWREGAGQRHRSEGRWPSASEAEEQLGRLRDTVEGEGDLGQGPEGGPQ